MGKPTHLTTDNMVNRRLKDYEQIPAKLARSLLPGLQGILSQDEIDIIDGPLRRGDISVLQHPLIERKLELMRMGVLNNSHDAFSKLYQFSSFLKKFPIKGDNSSCEAAALEKFKLGERQCEETNNRLLATKSHFSSVVAVTQQIIQDILGPVGNKFLRKKVQFGPGSTVNDNERNYTETGKFFKFTDRLVVPRRQRMYLAAHLSSQYAWMETLRLHYHINDTGRTRFEVEKLVFDKHFKVVDDNFCNKITFVPKNADEHRAIGVELNGSILLQKVFGDFIRDRLLKFGLNLNSQDRNVHFARLAKTFEFATVDIANASNTLSYETVKLLLPNEWFTHLDCLRSHYGECKPLDYHTKYSMFSSMGNGFTFELESLIFYATSLATFMVRNDYNLNLAKKNVAVYGDDLIVPQDCYKSLVQNLDYIGFKTNESKSFFSGNFFESCGSDFYDGVDVRPFFLKREIKTIKDAYFLCNSLLFKSIKTRNGFLFPAYLNLLKIIEKSCSPNYGPLHFYEGGNNGKREIIDDLEAVLRVPLEYAQKRGGVKFDSILFAWSYKKWVRISVEVPLSLNPSYSVRSARYLTFLDGALGGKVVYSGRNRHKLVRRTSSCWDGALKRRDLSLISVLFST